MYKSAINNIEWGKGAGIVAAFFLISLLSSNEPGNTFFVQDVSTFLAFLVVTLSLFSSLRLLTWPMKTLLSCMQPAAGDLAHQ